MQTYGNILTGPLGDLHSILSQLQITEDTNWFKGTRNNFIVEGKLYNEESEHGINLGRLSYLNVKMGDTVYFTFDRGYTFIYSGQAHDTYSSAMILVSKLVRAVE